MVNGDSVKFQRGGGVVVIPSGPPKELGRRPIGGESSVLERGTTIEKVVRAATRRGGGGVRTTVQELGPSPQDIERQIAEEKAAVALRKEAQLQAVVRESGRKARVRAGTIAGQLEAEEPDGLRIGLSERERRLKTGQVIRGRFAGLGAEAAVAGALLAEGAVGLIGAFGTQTIEFDPETGQRVDRSFRFSEESFIGKQRAKPISTERILGQALVFAPLIGGGIAGFVGGVGQVGVKQAVVETASAFSPFRIPTQTFGALESARAIKELKFDVVSFKQPKGEFTQRLVIGKAKDFADVSLISKQVVGKVGKQQVGVAVTDVFAPKTTFRGGQFIEGFRAVRTESFIFGKGGEASLIQDIGGVSIKTLLPGTAGGGRVLTRTRAVLGFDELGGLDATFNIGALKFDTQTTIGAVSKGAGEGITQFISGRGRRILRISPEKVSRRVRISEFNIRGFEFDLSRLTGDTGFGTGGFIPGGVKGGVSTGLELGAKQLSASVSNIAKVVTPKTLGAGVTPFVAPLVAGRGARQRFDRGMVMEAVKEKEFVMFDKPVVSDLGALDVTQRQRGGLRTGQRVIQETIQRPRQLLQPLQVQRQRPRQKERLRQTLDFAFPEVQDPFRTPGIVFAFAGFAPIGGFGIPPFRLASELPEPRRKTKGRKRRGRIAPSLTGTALFEFGGITGKLPKGFGGFGILPGQLRFRQKPINF